MFFPVLRNQFWGQFLTNRVGTSDDDLTSVVRGRRGRRRLISRRAASENKSYHREAEDAGKVHRRAWELRSPNRFHDASLSVHRGISVVAND
jgi:hypothetical protein